jgi:hypothetical protein
MVTVAVVLLLLGDRGAAASSDGFQLGGDFGLESGRYRGDGTGWGYGIEAGWNFDARRGVFASLNIGTNDRGDADPNIWAAVEGRLRISQSQRQGSVFPYVSIGLGAGLNWNPLPRVDAAIVTAPIEVGIGVGGQPPGSIMLGIRERPLLTIGDGNPAFSFLNRVGPVLMIRF